MLHASFRPSVSSGFCKIQCIQTEGLSNGEVNSTLRRSLKSYWDRRSFVSSYAPSLVRVNPVSLHQTVSPPPIHLVVEGRLGEPLPYCRFPEANRVDDSVLLLLGRHGHESRFFGVVRIEDQRGRRDVFHELVEVDGGEVDVAGVVRRRFGGHHCFWKGAMRGCRRRLGQSERLGTGAVSERASLGFSRRIGRGGRLDRILRRCGSKGRCLRVDLEEMPAPRSDRLSTSLRN